MIGPVKVCWLSFGLRRADMTMARQAVGQAGRQTDRQTGRQLFMDHVVVHVACPNPHPSLSHKHTHTRG